jgi:hypothetical protein
MAEALGTQFVRPSVFPDGPRYLCQKHHKYLKVGTDATFEDLLTPVYMLDPRTKENLVACPLCLNEQVKEKQIIVLPPSKVRHQCNSLSDCKHEGTFKCQQCGRHHCAMHMAVIGGDASRCTDCATDKGGAHAEYNDICAHPHCDADSTHYCQKCGMFYCQPHMSHKFQATCQDCEDA